MATITVRKPNIRGLMDTVSATVAKAADQTFKGGDLVIVPTGTGLATDFAAGASAVRLAVAGEDAAQLEAPSGSPNAAVVNLLRLHDGVIAEMNLVGTFAQTDIGGLYGVSAATHGVPYALKSDTTNTRVKVIGLAEGAVGDTNARVYVRFVDAANNLL